jgi:hypothetical protein
MVVDGTRQPLAYLYFEDEVTRRSSMRRAEKTATIRPGSEAETTS